MSIAVLSINDLPASLHSAAQTNLHCHIVSGSNTLEHLLHDFIESFAEAIQFVSDQGFNVLKPPGDRLYIKKRALFRTSSQIHQFTHCLLQIGQAYSYQKSRDDFIGFEDAKGG